MVVTYSELAKSDLDEIYDSSLEKWGVNQANKYMSDIERRFQWLADNPKLGLNRDEIKEGYKSYFEGKHTIFYRESGNNIEIIGIPHQSEDIEKHFEIDNLKNSYKDLLNQHTNMPFDEPDEAPEQTNKDLDL